MYNILYLQRRNARNLSHGKYVAQWMFFVILLEFGQLTLMMFSISGLDWILVFNATFDNISDISVRTVYMLEETGVPEEKHRPVASY